VAAMCDKAPLETHAHLVHEHLGHRVDSSTGSATCRGGILLTHAKQAPACRLVPKRLRGGRSLVPAVVKSLCPRGVDEPPVDEGGRRRLNGAPPWPEDEMQQ